MKRFALAMLLVAVPYAHAVTKPDPASFTLKVHVLSSGMFGGGISGAYRVLEALINGEPTQLEQSIVSGGILAPGDYPARISAAIHAPKKQLDTYIIYRGYDLLMPDGTVSIYTVTRLGPAVPLYTNP